MNKEALLDFYKKRYEFLLELSSDSMDISSILDTAIYEPYIDEKGDNPIMVVGNTPKIDDEMLPFNGRSKKLLNDILQDVGLDRKKDVVTTNAFPFMITEKTKKGNTTNRAPSSMETLIGSLLLIKEIEIIQPKVIVALGSTALQALKYINDQDFLNSIDDLSLNYFVVSKLNSIHLDNIVVGTSHYPDMFNLRNPIKKNELTRFFKRVFIIYTDGFDKLKTHKKNGFLAEYDNYSDIREYCHEVATTIFSENLLPTPRIYEEYFYKMLAKKDKELQHKIKNSLAIERNHYGSNVSDTDQVPDERKYDSLYRIHSKEYFELFYIPLSIAIAILFLALSSMPRKKQSTTAIVALVLALLAPIDSKAGLLDFIDIDKAQKSYNDGNYKEAIKLYKKIQKSNNSNQVHNNLANSYYKNREYDKAIEEYNKIETTHKEDAAKKLYNIANSYVKKNELQKALEKYNKSLSLHSDEDTKHNIEQVKKALKKQQQKQQNSKKDKKNSKKEQNKKENKSKNGKKESQKANEQNIAKENSNNKNKSQMSDNEEKKWIKELNKSQKTHIYRVPTTPQKPNNKYW